MLFQKRIKGSDQIPLQIALGCPQFIKLSQVSSYNMFIFCSFPCWISLKKKKNPTYFMFKGIPDFSCKLWVIDVKLKADTSTHSQLARP